MHVNCLVCIRCLITADLTGGGHCPFCSPRPLVFCYLACCFRHHQLCGLFCDLSRCLWFCRCSCYCLESFSCQCLALDFSCPMSPSDPSCGNSLAVKEQVGPLLPLGSPNPICTPDTALPSFLHFCATYLSP